MTQQGMTVTEAARALGVSTRSIYRYIQRGILQAKQVAGKSWVSLDSVRHFDKTRPATKVSQTSVTVDRDTWQNALTRLGQLETERRYLIEHKTSKSLEIAELKLKLVETKEELHKTRAALQKRKPGLFGRILK